jgi:electron transfer flavoprotein beta subunit
MDSQFVIEKSTGWLDETDLAFRINEYDEYAIEAAICLKEQLQMEPEITVLSIGPRRVEDALKKALAMGCDKGIHVLDEAYFEKDSWQIANVIATVARDKAFDLIFTGLQSQDRGSAQVGVVLAELLNFQCITTLVDFSFKDGVVAAKRELEGGVKALATAKLPAVITCQLGLNTPRYPTLPNIIKAKRKETLTFPIANLLKEESLIVTEKIYAAPKKHGGLLLEGDLETMADRLAGILKERTAAVRQEPR